MTKREIEYECPADETQEAKDCEQTFDAPEDAAGHALGAHDENFFGRLDAVPVEETEASTLEDFPKSEEDTPFDGDVNEEIKQDLEDAEAELESKLQLTETDEGTKLGSDVPDQEHSRGENSDESGSSVGFIRDLLSKVFG